MFPKIFKYNDNNKKLLKEYNRPMWRYAHNSELFGYYNNFSFKNRIKYVFKHPISFIKGLYTNYSMMLELIKVWYIKKQYKI